MPQKRYLGSFQRITTHFVAFQSALSSWLYAATSASVLTITCSQIPRTNANSNTQSNNHAADNNTTTNTNTDTRSSSNNDNQPYDKTVPNNQSSSEAVGSVDLSYNKKSNAYIFHDWIVLYFLF